MRGGIGGDGGVALRGIVSCGGSVVRSCEGCEGELRLYLVELERCVAVERRDD